MKNLFIVLSCELAYVGIYFSLFSKSLYRYGKIIDVYYPIGIGIGIVILFVLGKVILHWSNKFIISTIVVLVVLFFVFSWLVNLFAGDILRDFYMRGYENLFHLPEYFKNNRT